MLFDNSGISGSHHIVRNVMDHNTSGTDDDPVSNRYSWTDGCAATDPAVRADGDRKFHFLWFSSLDVVNRVLRCIEMTVGTNPGVVTNCDICLVKESAVAVDEDIFTKTDASTMVAVERCNDSDTFRDTRNQFLKKGSVLGFKLIGHTYLGAELLRSLDASHNLRICKVVHLLASHFLELSLHATMIIFLFSLKTKMAIISVKYILGSSKMVLEMKNL